MRRIIASTLLAVAAALMCMPVPQAGQQDVVIAQRLPVRCDPQSTTPYVAYNATDGQWHCTATVLPTAAELNKIAGVTAGTATASKAVVLDANKAIAGAKVSLGGGATTSPGALPGTVTDLTNATSGTTQSTEYTLNSVTLPASALNTNGQAVEVTAWGTLAANANAKNLKIYFGSTAVATITGSTASAKDYRITLQCLRTGSSTQSCVGSVTIDTGTSATWAVAAPSETDTNAIVVAVKSANTAAAAASATGKGMIAIFLNK